MKKKWLFGAALAAVVASAAPAMAARSITYTGAWSGDFSLNLSLGGSRLTTITFNVDPSQIATLGAYELTYAWFSVADSFGPDGRPTSIYSEGLDVMWADLGVSYTPTGFSVQVQGERNHCSPYKGPDFYCRYYDLEGVQLEGSTRPGQTVNYSYTISVVPEPATWAMMIAGFGLAGTALRSVRMANTHRENGAHSIM